LTVPPTRSRAAPRPLRRLTQDTCTTTALRYNSPGTSTPGAPGSMAGGSNAVTNQTDTNTVGGHESMPGYPHPVEPGAGPTPKEPASSQWLTGGPKPH